MSKLKIDYKESLLNAQKYIAQLEKENEKLKKHNEELIALINAERKRQEKCDDVHLRKIADLEKENAELNRQLEEADNATDCFNKQEEIIEQAKDHIKTLLDCLKQDTNDPQTNYYVCQYMDKAEQFLKEIEK